MGKWVSVLQVWEANWAPERLQRAARSSHTCFNDMIAQLTVVEEMMIGRKKQPSA